MCGRAMKNYIGALDQGTTSTRFIVFDSDNSVMSNSWYRKARWNASSGDIAQQIVSQPSIPIVPSKIARVRS